MTGRDFTTYSETKLLYDDGFNTIDATIVKHGPRYVMFLKDETLKPEPKKNIRLAFADKPTGPWGCAAPPISPDWVEGPTAIRIGGEWFLYFDAYTRDRYEGMKSGDLKTWIPITDSLSFPQSIRHGTVFAVPREMVEDLRKLRQESWLFF